MIYWITDRLGTASWDQVDDSFEGCIVDVRDLVDRRGNPVSLVRTKIDEALKHLRNGRKVIVCCDYGISRSNAVAAGILSIFEGTPFNEAIRRVMEATGHKAIKIEVLSVVRKAIGEDLDREIDAKKGRILVTGASGFIGSHLMRLLERTYYVVAPSRHDLDLRHDTIKLDLLVKEHRIDTLVHLANPRVYTTNEAMGLTLVMLKNVLDICLENRLFLIYLSGWEIYSGYKAQELRADESLAPRPRGTYGQTKMLCELLIEHYGRHEGLAYTIIRSSPVYGPGSDRPKFISNFLQKARHNQEIVVHKYLNGYPKLDLLYIDDLCRAILAAVERKVQGAINVGTGIGVSTTEVAQILINLLNSKSKIRHIEIETYASNIVMDISRARSVLEWSPEIPLKQGLASLIRAKRPQENPGKIRGEQHDRQTC